MNTGSRFATRPPAAYLRLGASEDHELQAYGLGPRLEAARLARGDAAPVSDHAQRRAAAADSLAHLSVDALRRAQKAAKTRETLWSVGQPVAKTFAVFGGMGTLASAFYASGNVGPGVAGIVGSAAVGLGSVGASFYASAKEAKASRDLERHGIELVRRGARV